MIGVAQGANQASVVVLGFHPPSVRPNSVLAIDNNMYCQQAGSQKHRNPSYMLISPFKTVPHTVSLRLNILGNLHAGSQRYMFSG